MATVTMILQHPHSLPTPVTALISKLIDFPHLKLSLRKHVDDHAGTKRTPGDDFMRLNNDSEVQSLSEADKYPAANIVSTLWLPI